MDDIDEGIGSNDSSASTNGCSLHNNILNNLKQLNGQKVFGKDTNGDVTNHKIDLLKLDKECVVKSISDTNDEKFVENDTQSDNCADFSRLVEQDQSDELKILESDEKCESDELCAKETTKEVIDMTSNCSRSISEPTTISENICSPKLENQNLSDSTKVKKQSTAFKSFFLNDKVRNSLKGLVDKVKSSPDKKDSDNVQLSDMSSTPSPSPSTPTNTELDTISEESVPGDSVRLRSEEKESTNPDVDDESLLAEGTEEGTAMEIGSDNEDELLKMSPSEESVKTNKKCNDFKKDGSVISQFDDDSNSNSNSLKINAIVDFLNDDISDSKSPVPVAQRRGRDLKGKSKNNQSSPKVEEESVDESAANVKEDNSEIEITDDMPESKETETPSNEEEEEEDDDDVIIESEFKPSNNEAKFDKSDHSDTQENLVAQSPKSAELEKVTMGSSSDSSADEEDDDDDVIFEGETKAVPKLAVNDQLSDNLSNVPDQKKDIPSSNLNCNDNKDTINNTVTKVDIVDDDDDCVIFEKEVKAENKIEQNCDNKNVNDVTVDVKGSVKDESLTNKLPENKLYVLGKLDTHNSKDCDTKDIKDVKIDVNSEINDPSSDRKRPADDKDIGESDTKRSRLDLGGLIGKLVTRVEPTSIELSDSDDESVADDESVSMSTDTVAEKDSVESDDDAENKERNRSDGQKYITVTEKELEDLVREKVKTYLTSQRDTMIAQLSQKVKDLQLNNNLWKRQVKDLQVKVNDVTVLQQKLEKRKAATQALRQITTRNVAVQVDDGKTASANRSPRKMVMPDRTPPPKADTPTMPIVTAPPGANGMIRLPIPQSSIAPPVLSAQIPQATQLITSGYQPPTVKSLLNTTRMQPTVCSSSASATTPTSVISLVQYPQQRLISHQATGASQGYFQLQPPNSSQAVTVSKFATKLVSTPGSVGKIIDLTVDDDGSKPRVVTLPASQMAQMAQMASVRQMLPPGTQIFRTQMPNSTYQLVFNSGTPGVRPGGVVGGTHMLQAIPQSTVVTMSSPAMLTPGTALTQSLAPPATVQPIPTVQTIQPVQPPPQKTHPAPFPATPTNVQIAGLKSLPPKPSLKISRVSQGIVLSWNMTITDMHAEVSNYQLFAYQETSAPPTYHLWKKVGDVKALPLPMACTLTQFQVGNKYHFAVRAMDIHNRVGNFSDPSSIHLTLVPTTTTGK